MGDCVFFYGTLMAGFENRRNADIDRFLTFLGRASIPAALFDLGPYPAAVPDPSGRVWGELYELANPASLLRVLDDIEEFDPETPDDCAYVRVKVTAAMGDAEAETRLAWVYFYNRPLEGVPRIGSGDYLEYFRSR